MHKNFATRALTSANHVYVTNKIGFDLKTFPSQTFISLLLNATHSLHRCHHINIIVNIHYIYKSMWTLGVQRYKVCCRTVRYAPYGSIRTREPQNYDMPVLFL